MVPTSIEGSYDQIFKETVAGLAVGEVPDLVVAYPSMVAEYMEAERAAGPRSRTSRVKSTA